MRADDVLEHAEDVDFEFFDARTFEDRAADADHARAKLIDAHLGRLRRSVHERQRGQEQCESKSA